MKTLILILLAMLTLSSCETQFMVDRRLKTYVDKFYAEGRARGKRIEKENLVIKLKPYLRQEYGSLGRTITDDGFDKQVTVLIDEEYFFNEDSAKVETVVFHELGHALLNRRHENKVPSLMNGNAEYLGYCHKRDCSVDRREELLDELFK